MPDDNITIHIYEYWICSMMYNIVLFICIHKNETYISTLVMFNVDYDYEYYHNEQFPEISITVSGEDQQHCSLFK